MRYFIVHMHVELHLGSGFQNQDMNVQRPSVDVKQSHISTEESTDECG